MPKRRHSLHADCMQAFAKEDEEEAEEDEEQQDDDQEDDETAEDDDGKFEDQPMRDNAGQQQQQSATSAMVISNPEESPVIVSVDYGELLTDDVCGLEPTEDDGVDNGYHQRISSMGSITVVSSNGTTLEDQARSSKRKKYEQKYRGIWEKDDRFKDWIAPVPNNSGRAYCKYCTCEVKAHIACLTRHTNSLKHMEQIASDPHHVPQTGPAVKIAELRLAAFWAEHNCLQQSDQLIDLLQSTFRDSKTVLELKMTATKCLRLLDTILAPYFRSALVKDIGKGYFSIFIDDSTDLDLHKTLGLVIRYVSHSQMRLITTFYRLLVLEHTDASSIADKILSALAEDNLDEKMLLGLGTDNNSVIMTGDQTASVFAILKQRVPKLILMKCVCHSLQAACSFATEALPGHLELLVRDTYCWFNDSPRHQMRYFEFLQMYNLLFSSCERKKVEKLDDTRWLSLFECVSAVLEHWDPLYMHFLHAKDAERCQKAAQLAEMYKDKKNMAYFVFLKFILKDFHTLNHMFENDGENMQMKLCEELLSFYERILYRIVEPERFEKVDISELPSFNFIEHLRSLKSVDFGDQFRLYIDCFPADQQYEIMKRCRDFLVEAAFQVKSRLPDNVEVFSHLAYLEPEKVMGFRPPNIERLLREVQLWPNLNVEQALNEYQLIRRREWSDIVYPVKFWLEVLENKFSYSTLGFHNIASYALTAYALPLSNLTVEKLFTKLVSLKVKRYRNPSDLKMLDSILTVKYGLECMARTSADFPIPEETLKRFATYSYLFDNSYSLDCWDADDTGDLDSEPLL